MNMSNKRDKNSEKTLKIVWFLGGLGNQMFQYAFYKSLEHYFKNVKADISGFKNYPLHNGLELERIFHLSVNKSSSFENVILGGGNSLFARARRKISTLNRCYFEKKNFDPHIFENKKRTYYWGYWQSEKYFNHIADQIRTDFTFKNQLNEKNLQVADAIARTSAVSVHVRRGDYVNHSVLGGVCDTEYYRKAIDHINSKVPDATYFIFSDDIAWCKEHLGIENCHYIDWNKEKESYIDMQLMSLCKHNIIANSSFSWWGAWLNSNPEKIVIAPSKWHNEEICDINDIIPNKWTRI